MGNANDLGISPAPWHYDDNGDKFEGVCAVWDANNVFVVGTGDMEDCDYREIANARLMAAAPDLYDALAELLEVAKAGEHPSSLTWGMAAAALAKARGEA